MLKLISDERLVVCGNRVIRLDNQEFAVLTRLVEHVGKLTRHDTLYVALWGSDAADWPQDYKGILPVIITGLRKKLSKFDGMCVQIGSDFGHGYILVCREAMAA